MDRTKPLLTEAEALRHYAADLELRADERGGRRGLRAMRTSLRHYAAGRFDEPDDTVLVWADLHIGHRNIIRYTNRPFRDRNDMDRTLWARMYEAADPDTTLVVVGDMLMGQAVGEASATMIRSLPCRESHLVVGNHDLHPHGRLRVAGFDHVWATMVSGGNPPLIWTHYPLRRVPEGYVNVHGHIHNRESAPQSPHINVSVEQLDYRPVRLSNLRALARALVAGRYPPGVTTLERLDSMRLAPGVGEGP